ncbi:hypothetical protein [Sporosarcina psychrophila]|uniref:Nitric oxide reductase large subunit n=1 Tax=Sporosarcina psychrophila TaxID=1476 RepID=A0ABV2K5S5_SPOPS
MLKIIGLLLIVAAIVRFEVPSLLRKKNKKELVVFLLFLSIGTGLGIAQVLGKPIPNPMDLLTFILRPINEMLFR